MKTHATSAAIVRGRLVRRGESGRSMNRELFTLGKVGRGSNRTFLHARPPLTSASPLSTTAPAFSLPDRSSK